MGHLQHRDARRLGEIDDRESGFVPACSVPVAVAGSQSAKILGVAGMADAVQPHQGNSPYSTLRMISRTRRRPSNVSQRSMGRSPPRAGSAVPSQSCARSRPPKCSRGGDEHAQRVQKPLGSSRTEGLSAVEAVQMTGGRSQQTDEETAMADRVDRLLDDFPRQSRSHRSDVGRPIDESGGRNADALDSLASGRMLHGESFSVSGCHERYHRPEKVRSLSSASMRRLDLQDKRPVYARERVGHLWLVDPTDRTPEALELREGEWVLIACAKDDEPTVRPGTGNPGRWSPTPTWCASTSCPPSPA